MIFLLSLGISCLYALFTLALWGVWWRLPYFAPAAHHIAPEGEILVSVLVPVRNEASHILALLQSLNRQTFPAGRFEVLVINDHSTDNTADIVQQFVLQAHYHLRLLQASDSPTHAPKKRALSEGVAAARGELILTTDGDCLAPPQWIGLMYACYVQYDAKIISAGVKFIQERDFFVQLQAVEFASLVGAGAATLSVGVPSMANGANLAYPRGLFETLGGYTDTAPIASGDDEFWVHKVAAHYPKEIFFLKHPESVVSTKAQSTWGDFVRQRQRWGSKWRYYKDTRVVLLAVFIFLANFNVLLSACLYLFGFVDTSSFLIIIGMKIIPEWFFVGNFLIYLRERRYLSLIPILQIIYPLYIVVFGILANAKTYEWKGRVLR